jgi:acetyl esterase/lipase
MLPEASRSTIRSRASSRAPRAARRIVVSVEYRLAPECPYPAGLEDTIGCAKRVLTVFEHAGLAHEPRLALIGDSGGGALSATVAHLSPSDSGPTVERQVLSTRCPTRATPMPSAWPIAASRLSSRTGW